MKTNSVLQVRIDADIRKQADQLFERLGITTSDAVRMFIMQSLESDGLPFEVKTDFSENGSIQSDQSGFCRLSFGCI